MDPALYRAAMGGKVDVLQQYAGQLKVQVTPNNNTVLHIAALFGKSQIVREAITTSSSLLCVPNVKGDTALHIAAREGHSDVVQTLIEFAKARDEEELESSFTITKELLEATNKDRDTALHDAARNNHPGVVRLLIEAGPGFTYTANCAGETPLYLAAERGYYDVLWRILETSREPAYGGPGGRTALHAAAIHGYQVLIKTLLDWKKDLAKEPDTYGWTPLHYAAQFGLVQIAKQLLDLDKSIAYFAAVGDDKKTALHVAASQGHVGVMEELISQCPDCWEMVNGKGQNILHIAVENGKTKMVKFILKNSSLSSLINQKDEDGNTALHLFVVANRSENDLLMHPRVDKMAFNKENRTPIDLITYSGVYLTAEVLIKIILRLFRVDPGWRNVVTKDNEVLSKPRSENKRVIIPRDIRKTGDTHLIVAALIATVTFAAGFTVPGGYDSNAGPNQGRAILTREAAFRVFVVSNTVAMIFSTCAVFIYFSSADYEDLSKLKSQYAIAAGLIVHATEAMLVAFITGTYAALAYSSSLAITVCVIGCLSFPIYFFDLRDTFLQHRFILGAFAARQGK